MRNACVFFLSFIVALYRTGGLLANEIATESLQAEILALQETVGALESDLKDLRSVVDSQKDMLEQQFLRIQALEKAAPPNRTDLMARPQGSPELAGRSQGFNPEMGAVGIVQAHLTENSADADGQDSVALKEFELNFAQYVDPYSRLDAVIDFNDNLENQNADIEEAYYSHWGLPFGFKGQLGKFRPKIGKQNLLHVEQLKTVDYPLVLQDFLGEEGLSSSGVRLQNMIPNPWDIPLEITGEILRGNNGRSFSGISRRAIFNTHLKSFWELSKEANLELGTTAMFGDENPPRVDFDGSGSVLSVTDPKGQDRYGVHLFGLDATYVWNMSQGRILEFQNEIYFQDRTSLVTANQNPWGFYSLADYRFSRRWSAGVRFDYLEPRSVRDFHEYTTAVSPYLTLWQSEFASFRLQYRHLDPADPQAKSDDAIFLQANFAIGSHKHPVQ